MLLVFADQHGAAQAFNGIEWAMCGRGRTATNAKYTAIAAFER